MNERLANDQLQEQFGTSIHHWKQWLQQRHLTGIATAVLDIVEPLGILGAQILYIAQPTIGLFTQRQSITLWARLLETPGGIAWLRQELANSPTLPMVSDESDR
jgi:hypothetical protein